MANAFANWTQEMCDAHNAKVAGAINRTVAVEKAIQRERKTPTVTAVPKKKKPLMNKTELAFYESLKARGHKTILCQAIMLRLGDGCQYRPDFVTVEFIVFGTDHPKVFLTAWETKAPHRFATAGITKLKCAAAAYPWIKFVLVMRDKKQWSEKVIGV